MFSGALASGKGRDNARHACARGPTERASQTPSPIVKRLLGNVQRSEDQSLHNVTGLHANRRLHVLGLLLLRRDLLPQTLDLEVQLLLVLG